METTRGDTVRLNISKDKDKESKIKDKVQSNPQRKDYYASGNNANGSRFLIIMLVKAHLKKEKKKNYKQKMNIYFGRLSIYRHIIFCDSVNKNCRGRMKKLVKVTRRLKMSSDLSRLVYKILR